MGPNQPLKGAILLLEEDPPQTISLDLLAILVCCCRIQNEIAGWSFLLRFQLFVARCWCGRDHLAPCLCQAGPKTAQKGPNPARRDPRLVQRAISGVDLLLLAVETTSLLMVVFKNRYFVIPEREPSTEARGPSREPIYRGRVALGSADDDS